jgi:hypothetical protein
MGYWLLQDAKARFSELVRKVRSEGPQHVTVHGRDEAASHELRDVRSQNWHQLALEPWILL